MKKIVFNISFKSQQGLSVYRDLEKLNQHTYSAFIPPPGAIPAVKKKFTREGFSLEAESGVGLTLSAGKELFDAFFKADVQKKRIKFIKEFDYWVHETDSELESPICREYIEKVFLPKQFFVLNQHMKETAMPELDYYHLKVPAGIREVAKVEAFNRENREGRGIKAAMIDTGLYPHRYYQESGYTFRVKPAVEGFDSTRDERGHGTGMTSVLLAVAPGVDFTMVKAADDAYSYPIPAFQRAVGTEPEIINCSWGIIGYEPHLYLEISHAIDKNIIVVFSAGNGSRDRRGASLQTIAHPDVVSVGGCYPCPDGSLEVSDISSGYYSDIFAGRYAPDICGICGHLPYAQLILFPSEPGSIFDKYNGQRDGTKPEDGWFVSSGTSAAAAYVSGLVALMLREYPFINRKNIKKYLEKCCVDVHKGANFMGHKPETGGWNQAVGFGFLRGDAIRKYMETRKPTEK